jgi:hypothetical protein
MADYGRGQQFSLITFHRGATVTEDFQGESAFDQPLLTRQRSQDTSRLVHSMACGKRRLEDLCSDPWAIQAENDAEHFISKFFRFDKLQLTGKLSESGDQMDVTFFVTFFDDAGNKIGEGGSVNFKGVRVPLDILPHSATTLPVPVISPTPAAP